MKRLSVLATVLLLLAACSAGPGLTPTDSPTPISVDLEGPGTAPAEVQRVRGVYDLLAEIGEPEREVVLANHWLDVTSNVLNVYLREGDPGAVEVAIRAALGEGAPSGGIRVVGPSDVETAMASWWAGEPAEGKRLGEYDNSQIEATTVSPSMMSICPLLARIPTAMGRS